MSITLNWTNKNTNVTNFKVYRGATRDTLALLTTLPSSASSYVDATAANNTFYYYQVNVIIGAADEVPGAITGHASVPDTGPGPTTLQAGDMEWGYFGFILATDFVTDTVYKALSTTGTSYATAVTRYMKMAYKGKILFVPTVPMRNMTTSPSAFAKALYNEGLWLGTGDSTLPHPGVGVGSAGVPQTKRVTAGSYEFIVRAPKGNETIDQAANAVTNPFGNIITAREPVCSEASLLASLNTSWLPFPAAMASGFQLPKVGGQDGLVTPYNGVYLTQHYRDNTTAVLMNGNNATPTCITTAAAGTSAVYYFVPVLELVAP